MPKFCDIVMKGGITSGIVYPAAVGEIAKIYTFKNVGGTSAGAIAAALTAAAERRRTLDGTSAGFDRLSAVPDYLMANNRLFNLFVPNATTAGLFRTLAGLAGRAKFKPAALAKLLGLVWAYPLPSLLGAALGVAFTVAVIRSSASTSEWLWVLGLILAVATAVLGVAIAVGVALIWDLLRRLPANCYGMVTGIDDANRASDAALCTWLASELELTAGVAQVPGAGRVPLTFGMLWDAHAAPSAQAREIKPDEPDVNLEMIATNVTWGRPYKFPITTEVFFFDPSEMRRFFPDYVVGWMVAKSRKPRDAREAERFAACAPRLALPVMGDLPVIVATRMSLAFPVLLSAVPLWAADFTLAPAQNGFNDLERCWFSDGGISSNFPITLFDSALPRWPTFAINLSGFPAGRTRDPSDEAKNVGMVSRNADGLLPTFTRISGLPGFFGAIFNAMQNWNDNTQSMLPGYRDRIVTVYLDGDEGGLNLDMPSSVLGRLRARGAAAGTLIANRFAAPSVLAPGKPVMGWENHRWLRFRSTMGALRTYMTTFATSASSPQAPDVRYDALVTATDSTPAHSYPLDPAARTPVAAIADRLTQNGDDLAALVALEEGMPKPAPYLTLRGSLES